MIAIEPILHRSAIHRAQGLIAEVVERGLRLAEVIFIERAEHGVGEPVVLAQHPSVERSGGDPAIPVQPAHRVRVEVVQVAQQEAQRVAHLAITFARDGEELAIGLDVVLIIEARHPPPADIGPEVAEQGIHLQRIAHRLAHLPAVLVDHEAVGEQGPEGAFGRRAQAAQQAQLEPPAVLIGPFKVEFDGIADVAATHHGVP